MRQKDDVLIRAIDRIIRDLSKVNMLFAASNVKVYSLYLSPASALGASKVTKTYVFKQWFIEFLIEAEVKIFANTQSLTHGRHRGARSFPSERRATSQTTLGTTRRVVAQPPGLRVHGTRYQPQ